MCATDEVVILVSEDVTHDRRVLACIAAYSAARLILVPADAGATRCARWRIVLQAALLMLDSIACALPLRSFLRRKWGVRFSHRAAALPVSWRSFVRAQRVAERLCATLRSVRTIHAHDLFCGIVGARLAASLGAELVYDAHEVEFHRNRTNSLLRTSFDVVAERRVVALAREVRVVNAPIASLYESLYRIPPGRVRVVLNDHFPECRSATAVEELAADRIAIVYVGAGTRGRQLDRLAQEAARLRVPVHAFFLGEVPEIAILSHWEIGAPEYQQDLLALTSRYRCAMWCCVDDVCLSYRLALPNKFFQALAIGIPVIAADGTYLAELVREQQLGLVFDGDNLEQIVADLRGPSFIDLARHACSFRQALSTGTPRI